ncbi:MAG: hypothetical protein ACKO7A_17215 [Microcystis sp.]
MNQSVNFLDQSKSSEKTGDRDWLDSDLSRLEDYEPYDWGEIDPLMLGKPVQYVSSIGLVVEGGKD